MFGIWDVFLMIFLGRGMLYMGCILGCELLIYKVSISLLNLLMNNFNLRYF